jgi:DNA polymerase III alpha subunit (gram-positive type)
MTDGEFYIVVDIEASGPTPLENAMLSLGASTLDSPPETFYIEFVPDKTGYTEEAMGIHNLTFDALNKNGTPPQQAMQQFADWVTSVTPHNATPVFTAFNAPFDWMFVNTYFHQYLSYNPFGHKALDIKALFMGVHHTTFTDTSHHQVCNHYNLVSSLSHHALEDAIQESTLLKMILQDLKEMK